MISEHHEVARYRVAEQIRVAEMRARRNEQRDALRADGSNGGPRHELAGVLRRLADRLEPQPRHRRTGLSVVR
ncbi:hypothetical protein [Streptomyces sp. SID13031]|uniref:hypothetical protein n=1 Tax=Streptomyces sp. SID13031 TaxID=2706046 RepID=UPI0013CDB588|nr:hypothetical protein [Streptomyces sp. SID13031]NEA36082.1 hypothetical protein [Streptomyces sp. SID13031]